MPSFTITADDMDAIALGGAFLGTGGGGDPYVGKLMAKAAIGQHGPVQVLDVDAVPDDMLCVPVAMMGAPTVMLEKLPSGTEALEALRQLEAFLQRKAGAIVCIEAGGLNSTIPFAVAASTGLPLVDGDGMGRAFPELQMVSLTMHGIKSTPMVIADEKGNSSVLNTISNLWTEKLARVQTIQMGGAALIALYPMSGAALKRALLRNTLSLVREMGQTILSERAAKRHPGAAIVERLGGHVLFKGRVTDIDRQTVGGFARGSATLTGIDEDAGKTFSVDFQNEFLVAREGADRILATTPDLICALDADGGLPVTTEQIRYGLAVQYIGLPADPQWRSPAGLELAGPGYFGYAHPFTPIEQLRP